MPGRVWFYANYHCNLECAYCLTESAPSSPGRQLKHEEVVSLAQQAKDLGFTEIGITGGEPFMSRSFPELVADVAAILPVVVLSNGTLFTDSRLEAMKPLADLPVAIQISLDAPEADRNDEFRGPENFAKVIEAIPKLVAMGIKVRIATTVEPDRLDPDDHEKLCELHRGLGVSDDDHLVRPIIQRGRAITGEMGVVFDHSQIPAELTITADGAFWSPFGPTIFRGRVDTDLLITRTVDPLAIPAGHLMNLALDLPEGNDANLGIR